MQKLPLSEEGIRALVDGFYDKVRDDQNLAPVFNAAIGDTAEAWKPHLERMYSFWGTIMMGTGGYTGNPLQKHRELPPFPEPFFDRWLELFAETADEVLTPEAANLFKHRSQRMSQVLRRGIYHAA